MDDVSPRERDVLAAVARHRTNAEIAAELFISVRTVESHVSSLLRKLDVADRRGLIAVAGAWTGAVRQAPPLPVPLTPFVGRAAERAGLVAALREHRMVTAVGPGGVGKTRLALAVADELAGELRDGVWYVDLVPVTDPAAVGAAMAGAFGLGEHRGRSPEETLLSWLADRRLLLVVDNCEHVVEGVVPLLERVLAGAPGVTVLATSRVRLLVPYEWVCPVPGLTVAEGDGDAERLFLARAAAAGVTVPPDQRPRVSALCARLDGMALALELAAARLPALGLSGLEAGLDDRLSLLAGGHRADERHRSLRSAIDWSWTLLGDAQRLVLQAVSAFGTPFAIDDAVAVSRGVTELPAVLGTLVDASLLVCVPTGGEMRYQALETIRQYAAERLAEAGLDDDVHRAHAGWALALGEHRRDDAPTGPASSPWRAGAERASDELRAALGWASAHGDPQACALATRLAELAFLRGMPAESQRRYEQAAALAKSPAELALSLSRAAGAAVSRHFGGEALGLHGAAADVAESAGDAAFAAGELAAWAELVGRATGLMSSVPDRAATEDVVARARRLAAGHPAAEARLEVAELWLTVMRDGRDDGDEVAAVVEAAAADGAWLAECAALDLLMSVRLEASDLAGAHAANERRMAVLRDRPVTAEAGLEFFDAYNMTTDTAVGIGDLVAARRYAEMVRDLPFHREEGHLGSARLLVVSTLAGQLAEALTLADRFLAGWRLAGRPHDGDLNRGAYAAATACGLVGDDAGRAAWQDIVAEMMTPQLADRDSRCYEALDALVLLHHGQLDAALDRLSGSAPEDARTWRDGLWRPWHAALWAESSVLAGLPDAADRVARAAAVVVGNRVAEALVARAAGLLAGDVDAVLAQRPVLDACGTPYQAARTLVLAGGPSRAAGEHELSRLGAAPTVLT